MPRSAWARLGASLTPSPSMATRWPACWSSRMVSTFRSGVASAIHRSPPIAVAVASVMDRVSPESSRVRMPRWCRAVQRVVAVLPQVRDIRRGGSCAVDLCSVAAGRVDAYYERGVNYWDWAAGGLIATEAGARLGGLDGRAPSHELTLAAGSRPIWWTPTTSGASTTGTGPPAG